MLRHLERHVEHVRLSEHLLPPWVADPLTRDGVGVVGLHEPHDQVRHHLDDWLEIDGLFGYGFRPRELQLKVFEAVDRTADVQQVLRDARRSTCSFSLEYGKALKGRTL